MGGTSTDVSRYDNNYEHVFETTVAGITIQAPQVCLHRLRLCVNPSFTDSWISTLLPLEVAVGCSLDLVCLWLDPNQQVLILALLAMEKVLNIFVLFLVFIHVHM